MRREAIYRVSLTGLVLSEVVTGPRGLHEGVLGTAVNFS